jgi:hypothetical protein
MEHIARRSVVALALSIVALVGVCATGAWASMRPPIAEFLAPGATNIQVRDIGWGQRTISYAASGERYAWYFSIASRLMADGWVPPDKWGPSSQFNTYTHVSPLWIGYLWEQAELRGEPQYARITVRRWVTVPWRIYLRYVMSIPSQSHTKSRIGS